MASRSGRGTPGPLSLTTIETVVLSALARMPIFLSAGGVYFQALLRRLLTACARAARFPKTTSPGSISERTSASPPSFMASNAAMASPMSSVTCTGPRSRAARRDSILDS